MNPAPNETDLVAVRGAVEATAGPEATVRASDADRDSKKRLQRILLAVLGGFFVLIGVSMWLVPLLSQSPLRAVPNNALGALLLPPNSPATAHLRQFFPLPETSAGRERVLIATRNPLAVGLVVRVNTPDALLALSADAEISVTPISDRLIAVGPPAFLEALKNQRGLPWWVRARAAARLRASDGVILWGTDERAPWLIGELRATKKTLRATFNLPQAADTTLRALEPELQNRMRDVLATILPEKRPFRLPDGSVARELVVDTRRIDQTPFLSSEQADSAPDDCQKPKNDQILRLTLDFYEKKPAVFVSLLKQAISFCLESGDNL